MFSLTFSVKKIFPQYDHTLEEETQAKKVSWGFEKKFSFMKYPVLLLEMVQVTVPIIFDFYLKNGLVKTCILLQTYSV